MDIPINDRTINVVADILAYQRIKRTNPKADHPLLGYYAFNQEQRSWLIEAQKDNARDILLALKEIDVRCKWCDEMIFKVSPDLDDQRYRHAETNDVMCNLIPDVYGWRKNATRKDI